MALHNLKIVVVDGGRGGRSGAGGGGDKKRKEKNKYKDTPLYKMLHAKETVKDKIQTGMSPSSVFAMDMGLRVAGQLVKQTANYYISDIGRRTGDSNYQNMINKQLNIVTDTLGVAGSALSGAAAGSMFGPVGAGIGLVIGATSSAISIGFKVAEAERQYQHEMFKQETSQQYALSRANYSIFTGRRV